MSEQALSFSTAAVDDSDELARAEFYGLLAGVYWRRRTQRCYEQFSVAVTAGAAARCVARIAVAGTRGGDARDPAGRGAG